MLHIDSALTPILLLFFPKMWYIFFFRISLLINSKEQREYWQAPFSRVTMGLPRWTLLYFNLAFSPGLLTNSSGGINQNFLSATVCFTLNFSLEKFKWTGNTGGLSYIHLAVEIFFSSLAENQVCQLLQPRPPLNPRYRCPFASFSVMYMGISMLC